MDYDRFLREVCPPLGLRWRKYRRRSARRRIETRVRELGLGGFDAYRDLLSRDRAEAAALADRMRVTVTRFFRERDRWDVLATRVLPELLAAAETRDPLRAWSVGCCGGEEPYTLAMLWAEEIQAAHPGRTIAVLATDIDTDVLERARRSLYPSGALREVPASIRDRWFVREGPSWRLKPLATRGVRFLRHNLVEDSPPAGIDLALCRYLAFTYYEGFRRYEAARRIWSAVRPGGALMIGRKEGLGPRDLELFRPWEGAVGFFRRVG